MKKSSTTLVAVIIVIVLVVLGIAIFHKSPKPKAPSSGTTSYSSTSSGSNIPAPTTTTSAIVTTKSNSTDGSYLVDASDNTLYTYGGDTSGVSNCTGSCLASWPAYQDKSSTTGLPVNIGTITRSDNGEIQYTYKGLPLYTFVGDSGPGKVTGNGVSNFQLAKP